MSAAPIALTSANEGGRSSSGGGPAAAGRTSAKPTTTSASTATIFVTIRAFWTVAPALTPRQLMAVRTASMTTAIVLSPTPSRVSSTT